MDPRDPSSWTTSSTWQEGYSAFIDINRITATPPDSSVEVEELKRLIDTGSSQLRMKVLNGILMVRRINSASAIFRMTPSEIVISRTLPVNLKKLVKELAKREGKQLGMINSGIAMAGQAITYYAFEHAPDRDDSVLFQAQMDFGDGFMEDEYEDPQTDHGCDDPDCEIY